MSINFSDLQVIMQKSQEIERMHQIQQHQTRVQQQQFAQKLEEEARQKENRVQQEEVSEKVNMDNRQSSKNNEQERQEKNTKNQDGNINEPGVNPDSGHFIDLEV